MGEIRKKAQRLVWGMNYILERQPDTDMDVHDGFLYCGSTEGFDIHDKAALQSWGWIEDQESWAFPV